MDNQGLLTAQQTIIKRMGGWPCFGPTESDRLAGAEQDDQLDELSKSIARTKHIAVAIDEEVTDQDKLLQGLSAHVDSTGAKLRNTTRRVERTEKSASTKCLWAIICILFLGLIATVVLGATSARTSLSGSPSHQHSSLSVLFSV
jgi:hypothetical protein